MPDVELVREGRIAVLTIDRPHARNAIALATMDELDRALAELAASDASLAVLRGAGDRAFIAGGDLKELESKRDEAFAAAMAARMRATLDRIPALPMPVMAAVNGAALGGGAEVAVACDFRVAADDARIGFTQVLLGLMPAWGGIERLVGMVGRSRALHLLSTGRVLSGTEAAALGVVEEAVPRVDFEARWRELAESVAQTPRAALAGIKAAVEAVRPGSHPELAPSAIAAFARTWADPDHWRMAAELERRRRRPAAERDTR